MQTYKLRVQTDADGTATVNVPVGAPSREVEIVVVVENIPPVETDELGWPIGFFERTYGALADDPIDRGTELPPEVRDEIE